MKKKNSYKRFILKMSAGAIIGMVLGGTGMYFIERASDWKEIGTITLHISGIEQLILPGMAVVLALSVIAEEWICHCLKKNCNALLKADDEECDRLEYEEEKFGAWLTGVNVLSQVLCILILAFGYSLDYIGSGGSTSITFLWACILFLSCFFYDGIMQVRYVKLVQKVHPEKKGDPSSSKFQKEWLASCDEAEKEIVFQSAYKAYMCMNKVIPLLLLLTLILNLFFNTGILAIIVVAGMYLVMTVAYSKACVQIRKEKIFR